jgi:phosphopantetheinyl transferase (holo-ACP synthase)
MQTFFSTLVKSREVLFSDLETRYSVEEFCLSFAAKEALIKAIPDLNILTLKNITVEVQPSYELKLTSSSETSLLREYEVEGAYCISGDNALVILVATKKPLLAQNYA